MELQQHFEQVRLLIRKGQAKALQLAYTEQLTVYWQVGAYLYHRLLAADYGDKVVDELADWLKKKEPTLKGFDRRFLYRMKDFYRTWYGVNWEALKEHGIVEFIENQPGIIVASVKPQFKELPNILSNLSWTHHREIISQARDLEEKIFYLLLAIKEKHTVRELQRQINSGLYERQKLSTRQIIATQHPDAKIIPKIFRDKYIFEFLDLPEPYTENDLKTGLVKRLKQFILEIGRDFTFIGEEYRLQVGKQDYYLDLLFFHRELQCLVIFELKTVSFQPEFLGKLNFYLEVLDTEVKKAHEKPSIGVLLCTANDKDIVRFAMSRNISPALVAEYETRLIDKNLLQQMLHEWMESIV